MEDNGFILKNKKDAMFSSLIQLFILKNKKDVKFSSIIQLFILIAESLNLLEIDLVVERNFCRPEVV